MAADDDKIVFRSTLAWVWFGVAVALTIYLLADMWARATPWDAFLVAPWLLAVCWVVWVFLVTPRIEAGARGVRLYNLLRIIDLPWPAVSEVRLRYSAEFTLREGGRITAWGGSSRRLHRSIGRRSAEDPAETEAEALQRLHNNSEGRLAPVIKTWDWSSIAAAVVIVTWIVFSLTQSNGVVLPA